jgi:SAM-dependent methyltransferase
MIIFGTCIGDAERYEQIALPAIRRCAGPEDEIVSLPGDEGIGAAYNAIILQARRRHGCEALVLLHEDVELIDDNFRPKVLHALGEPGVGIVGVAGARDLTGLEWWDSIHHAGLVFETRGVLDFGRREAEVDAVDGLLMALSPLAFGRLEFDQRSFPDFHGYDVDYCLQARAAGLKVIVAAIDVLHRTKTGLGDAAGFRAADLELRRKWRSKLGHRPWLPRSVLVNWARLASQVRRVRTSPDPASEVAGAVRWTTSSLMRRARSARDTTKSSLRPVHGAHEVRAASNDEQRTTLCPACRTTTTVEPTRTSIDATRRVVTCPSCGSGVTWPPPDGQIAGSGLCDSVDSVPRLRRGVRTDAARARLSWLQLYVPGGSLLELGAATGEFLWVATEAGYEAFGIEPNPSAAALARQLGVDVVTGDLTDWLREYAGYQVDVVALWDVLGHTPDPLALLTRAATILKADGTVAIEVANFAAAAAMPNAELLGSEAFDDHWFHYTSDGIERLLVAAGLQPTVMLECSKRSYTSLSRWRTLQNQALLERRAWPRLEILRVVAHKARGQRGGAR